MSDPRAGEDWMRECVEAAKEVAERLLMDAPNYDADTRLVAASDLLRLTQELNAALDPRVAWTERYRIHNQRGSDGPCECDDCRIELAAHQSHEEVVQVGWVKWDGDAFFDFRYSAPSDRHGLVIADGYVPVYADAAEVPGA